MSRDGRVDFLAMATPGAGKTRLALRLAHDLLQRKVAARIVVICPTNHLRQQWARAAHEAGVRLDPFLSNDQPKESRDYHGCVVTYQQVCLAPTVYRLACRQSPTLAIFDELHHAGDGKDWGAALRDSFGQAVKRLALSGTPFRTDNNPIPFVTYDQDQSVPDFSYGYREALAEKVCRPIVFPTYEGDLSWVSRGKEMTAKFADQLGRRKQQERLKTALLHDEWVTSVIKDADAELTHLRKHGHAEAGGLIVAMDQDHARQLAVHVKAMSGTAPRVAISDDPQSTKTIERFANSKDRWLIAVNMVSEGVDIPRLRVGVYATNVQTEMYFRQVVGRFVRMQSSLPASQRAYLYLPRDPRLVEYAEAIKAERDHVLLESAAAEPRTLFDTHPNETEPFFPLRGVAVAHGRIGDEEEATAESGTLPLQSDTLPLHERKEHMRQTHKGLVIQVAQRSGVEHRRINLELVRRTGSRIENASLDQLKRRIKQLEKWIEHGYSERR